ncbi:LOW QUALITY PROTEIN: TLR4 interactor with leucine rich repeats [Acanthochromis polyacanthus]|uniref:LOW QUALITY PROTEIN: TLR4 interactor with leucine rich repeats n=1 Tax=Acanthochromis polyacanthus TaxID=80966 RepID=UPI0022343F13|nr:LOW QUALITY PROTEIN: TLR4 interactor with leucine rich repeats [Acanthochromis polyacanthus]
MKPSVFLLLLLSEASCRSHSSWCELGCDCQREPKFTICSRAQLTEPPSRVPSTTELLDLSDNLISSITTSSFSSNRKLRVLLLQSNNISLVEDGSFSQLEFLQKLDLSWNRISSLTEGFSVGLVFLRELQLSHNRLTSLDSRSFLHLDGLQRLNLSSNSIHSIQVRSFSPMSALRQLHLQDNQLGSLKSGIFSMLRSLEVLNLAGNRISDTELGVFKPLTSMTLLNLADNRMSAVYFKTFLSIHTYSTHILLEGNPWNCDCDLQRVFRKLRSIQRLFLDDYYNLTCKTPPVLHDYLLMDVDTELCIAETVTVLIITITVVITVLAAMLMGERTRKKRKRGCTGRSREICQTSRTTELLQSHISVFLPSWKRFQILQFVLLDSSQTVQEITPEALQMQLILPEHELVDDTETEI